MAYTPELSSLTNVQQVAPGIGAGILALLFVAFLWRKVVSIEVTSKTMRDLGDIIHNGAVSFLIQEYKVLSVFVVVVALALIGVLYDVYDNGTNAKLSQKQELLGLWTAMAMVVGAVLSASAGYLGMSIATLANTRTCQESEKGLNEGLHVAFASGSIMGMTVVAFGILGLSLLYLCFAHYSPTDAGFVWQIMSGFGFGASSIALFARVGGGIYTKAADVGADLVGKVEQGLPEDHANNPATIADNVGDNVGDVAGMGADLFESYVGSIIAACTLAVVEFRGRDAINAVALPFWISGFGIICCIIGTFAVKTKNGDVDTSDKAQATKVLNKLLKTIRNGIWFAGLLVTLMSVITVYLLFNLSVNIQYGTPGALDTTTGWKIFMCIIIGLVVGNVIGSFTEYCTSYTESPTQSIGRASEYGPATVVLQGLGVGMMSTVVPTLAICVAIIACDELSGVYGVAIAAVGMLSTLGITLATDAYGPVADNAGGIAEMDPSCSASTRDTTDALDALGNTTAATGKGFAIGSAVLTASALMSAFMTAVGVKCVDLKNPIVIVGLLIGAMLPSIFAALTMLSVSKAAMSIIAEVRKQFRDHPHLKNENKIYTDKSDTQYPPADSTRCIQIATNASLQEMLLPGGLAVFTPIIVGFILGPSGLAGVLAGALSAGFMLAVTMSNAGGAWDNAKKWVEKGGLKIGSRTVKKGDMEHAAVVSGDTVGDPFKDTSGPALNVLIKLMTLVSLVFAPRLRKIYDTDKLRESGFARGGVPVGVLIIFITFPIMFFLQKKFNEKNRKDTAKAMEGASSKPASSKPVKAAYVEQSMSNDYVSNGYNNNDGDY